MQGDLCSTRVRFSISRVHRYMVIKAKDRVRVSMNFVSISGLTFHIIVNFLSVSLSLFLF